MAKGKPYSYAEIRPETPEILRYLENRHYKSPEWNRDAGIKNKDRGLELSKWMTAWLPVWNTSISYRVKRRRGGFNQQCH